MAKEGWDLNYHSKAHKGGLLVGIFSKKLSSRFHRSRLLEVSKGIV